MPQFDSGLIRRSWPGRRSLLTALLLPLTTAAWAQLGGTYYVGNSTSPDASRTYTTLPDAMTALGTGVTSGTSVTFVLLDASYALGATSLIVPAATLSAGQGVSIVPAAGVSPVITGSSTTALIDLNGTDYLTISGYNGSTSARTLTLRNTAAGPAVLLRNDATNNTLRNLVLESNASGSSGTVLFSTTTGTIGNDLNTVASCDVRAVNNSAITVPANAIYSLGTATATNSDNTIRGCNIYNFSAGGVFLNNTGNGGNWTVGGPTAADGNQLYQMAARSADLRNIRLTAGDGQLVSNNHIYQTTGALGGAFYGVVVVGGGGHTITNNYIGGSAASAGGSPLVVGGSGFLYGFYLSLGGTTASTVQGNTVANIAATTTGTAYGIDLLGTTTATITGNTFGSATGTGFTAAGPLYGIQVENTASASIQTNTFAGFSTTNGLLAYVYLTGSAASTVSGNTMTGLATPVTAGIHAGVYGTGSGTLTVSNNTISGLTNAAGVLAGVYISGSSPATVSGNTISGLSNALAASAQLAGINSTGSGVVSITSNTLSNLTQSGNSSNLYGIQGNSVAGSNVTGNTITNVTYSGTSTGQTAYGISAGGSNSISNNTITTVQATGTANANVRGIYIGGAGAAATVNGNSVSNVLNATTGAATSTAGIFVGATSGVMGAVTVSGNRINNVGTSAATAPTGGTNAFVVTGLLCGASAAGSVIERNRVWNVYGSSAGTGANADQVRGLAVQGSYSGTFANNQISLAAGTTTQQTYGIQDLSSGGTNSFYYNSVYLAPASAAAASSYGFWRSAATTPPTVELRNNIFDNERTATTGAAAYAIGTASTTGWTTTTSNYNLLINSNAATVGNWGGTALGFAGWKATQAAGSGGDASSLSVSSATVAASNLFVDVTAGNLNLNPASSEAWYANGNGMQLAGQTADFNSATTSRATTVTGGGTDIGSHETTPTSTPPALTVSAAPALGGTQVLSLGGRTLATIIYDNAGTVPTALTARYYSGTNPVVSPLTTRYANSYLDVTATGGSAYTYGIVLNYDDALLGSIVAEANQRLLKHNPDGTYTFYPSTVADATANTLTATGLSSFGQLFGTDQANPLPVTLTSFSAFRRGDNAELDWVTATEKNSAGYEVQVATDGRTFRTLGFVKSGAAFSTAPQYYQFLDAESGKTGLRYYRLRQVDSDGTATYSPVQAVSFEGNTGGAALEAFPSPFATELTVAVTAAIPAENVPLTLTDATGRTVYSQLVTLPAGPSRLALRQLAGLPAGVYLLQVGPAGAVQRLKVVKQ